MIEQGRRRCSRLLKTLSAGLEKTTLKVHFEVAGGYLAEQILLYGESRGIDHVVVGQRGHTILDRWLLGSVARQVIVHAACAPAGRG